MEPIETFFLWGISFCALFFSVFWIILLKTKEEKMLDAPHLKKYPFVSFIIPTMNGAKTLPRTIKNLLQIKYPKNRYEIIVVPNNCTDGGKTAELAKKFAKKHKSIIATQNIKVPKGLMGKAYAFNKVLKTAKGSLVGCLDDDTIVSNDSLLYMVPVIKRKNVAAVIPACKVYEPKNLLEKVQVMEYALSSFARKLLAFVGALYVTPGVLSLYRKDILVKEGGMDVNNITEDFELAVRLNKHGYDVESQINSVSWTEVPNNIRAFHRQRVRWARGFLATIVKHKDMLFKAKHGILGSFLLPFILILATFSLFVTGFIIYGLVKGAIFVAANFQNFTLDSLRLSIFDYNPLVTIITILILIGLYFLYKAYQYLGYKWNYPLATVIYFTYYQPILASYWLFGFIYEAARIKRKW